MTQLLHYECVYVCVLHKPSMHTSGQVTAPTSGLFSASLATGLCLARFLVPIKDFDYKHLDEIEHVGQGFHSTEKVLLDEHQALKSS